ncbi:MAG: polysaccharide deacetylase family protein [Methylococcales bacterium]|nr:polysaccharide deacetylase family protein [Methylococcales bacterium]
MGKKCIKKVIFFVLNSCLKTKYLNKINSENYLTILNLHKVSNDENPFYPSLSPKLFDEFLKYVSKEFNIITFKEIERSKNRRKPNIILSFDDGYYDFLEYAMPILDKYKICVNQNIIPNCVETGKPVWDTMLGDLLSQAPIELVNEINLPSFEMKLNKFNKGQYALALTRYLKQRSKNEREELWTEIDNIMHRLDIKFTRMLNKNELAQIAQVHEIGVHSYEHESMGLESQEYFEMDFLKCKDYFKNTLNFPMDIYAFPSGSYKDYQLDFLGQNGIKHILLVDEKYSNYNTNRHFRFTYYADSISEVKLRAVGFKIN